MEHCLLFLSAITPVHNGAGEGLGIIDRPIIRERITNFPIIQASSIKGTTRDEYLFNTLSKDEKRKEKVYALFGPDQGELHAGAISFSDAGILCFPIRSLKGCFVWATSPLLLYRFSRFVEMSGLDDTFPKLKELLSRNEIHSDMNRVFINPEAEDMLLVGKEEPKKIVLEEFPKCITLFDKLKEFAQEIGDILFPPDSLMKNHFIKKFVLIPEDTFKYFVTHATEVVPNIRIDNETGTSKEGLRYTEYLPSETILYSLLGFDRTKSKDAKELELDEAVKVKKFFIENRPERLQIGADETKGKGFVTLCLVQGDSHV